jgi:hypothetical protein
MTATTHASNALRRKDALSHMALTRLGDANNQYPQQLVQVRKRTSPVSRWRLQPDDVVPPTAGNTFLPANATTPQLNALLHAAHSPGSSDQEQARERAHPSSSGGGSDLDNGDAACKTLSTQRSVAHGSDTFMTLTTNINNSGPISVQGREESAPELGLGGGSDLDDATLPASSRSAQSVMYAVRVGKLLLFSCATRRSAVLMSASAISGHVGAAITSARSRAPPPCTLHGQN